MKRTSALLAMLLCFALLLTGCGKAESGDVTYTVTVKDALGTPYTTGVVVKFLQNGEQVAMQPCDENGTAAKTLAAGDYTVELSFTDTETTYHYDKDLTLTAEKTALDVVLAEGVKGEATPLSVGSEECDAYPIAVGGTYVELAANRRNYFLFTPTGEGTYKFFVADGTDATLGYYGAPHFVQETSTVELTDGAFTISVSSSMIGTGDSGTSVYVIGVDSEATSCVLAVERIGAAQKTLEDEPWTIYEAKTEPAAYTLPAGAAIKEFDLTANYTVVLNEADGYYHLDTADGPLVLVRLAEDSDYIASFQTILDRSGVSKYFFDENGEFVKKESYSECLLEYIACADEAEGVYPLTEDLKYIIQQRGDYVGWWDVDSPSYLFVDAEGYDIPDINHDIAWLLMCCYIG